MYHFQRYQSKKPGRHKPSPSSSAAASFCSSSCCLCACSLRTWYLSCEAGLRMLPVLAIADEKPQAWVKTENNDHINLKVAGQDGSVVQFKIKRHTPLSKLMKAYCERQVRSWHVYFLWIKRTLKNTNIFLRNRNQHNVTIDCFW